MIATLPQGTCYMLQRSRLDEKGRSNCCSGDAVPRAVDRQQLTNVFLIHG